MGEVDLSLPVEEAVLPNKMVGHSEILEIVMNIRNSSVRRTILLNQGIDYDRAAKFFHNDSKSVEQFSVEDVVLLKLERAMNLSERLFKIEQVRVLTQ